MRVSPPNTFLDRPPVLYVWRPFYRLIVTPLVLPFLSAIRGFLFFPYEQRTQLLQAQIEQLQLQLAQTHAKLDTLSAQNGDVLKKIDLTYLDSLGQWSAIEHVVVTTLRLSDRAAAKRTAILQNIESQQASMPPSLANLMHAVEECVVQQRAISADVLATARDQRVMWSQMENLLMSVLSHPSTRSAAAGSSSRLGSPPE